ncbi:cytochrome C oxidase subunit I [Sphingobacterium sp. DN00404]|uniref:Cytochrome C oxidase subunit I n=1 Tax=Sphingobacterium micropteri TaxID=2763501 RepID=A0ABR7YJG3_9SPHI|nr:cytochrome C oxidase subunit I [Sphingobacterium micropteri]MBD1431468.1 cytochrome C oxidase subunit I [Sphingobacterium micropteri]
MMSPLIGGLQKTTNYKVVLPFYIYAALGFLTGTILLLCHTETVGAHYFNPQALAITHTMALAWGTMIIFGASHQLLPVLVEGELDSDRLAYLTFIFTAIGTPLLVYGFYVFNMGLTLQIGAILVNIGVICYLANVLGSSFKSNRWNVHAWYVITSTLWLFATTFFGLLLVLNFRSPILPSNSVDYLSFHAHLGIVGWFVLMVIGVGSRLIPMFMISKYTNDRILWLIFALLNIALISFSVCYLAGFSTLTFYIPIVLGLSAILLFGNHCYQAYKVRIRKRVDQQMKTSLISVAQMLLPLVMLIIALALLPQEQFPGMVMIYGFCIFFGWLTAIILGMTFKTMPFIVWNKIYRNKAHQGKTPTPKEIFNDRIYQIMLYSYLVGFTLFILGMIIRNQVILKIGALALLIAAILYVYNVIVTAAHKARQL